MKYRRTQKPTETWRGGEDFIKGKPRGQAARTGKELFVSPVELLISPGHHGSQHEGIVTGDGGTTRLLERDSDSPTHGEETPAPEPLLAGQSSRGKPVKETHCGAGGTHSSHISLPSPPLRFPRAQGTGGSSNNIKAHPETTPVNPTKPSRGVTVDHLSNGITRNGRAAEGAVPPGATWIMMPLRATCRPAERGMRLGLWSFSWSWWSLFLLLLSGWTHGLNAQGKSCC
ncbi:hypothetical protein J4Q44_G00293290 [Coregonus suidteri]|uniref:Uncharacterized protein n=1 Tax=Coregonus suidteri TaxID=861788 RepID=A0AAN8LI76_9TELE